MRGSFAVQVHGWRGVWLDRQLFITVLHAGFVSFGLSRYVLSDQLKAIAEQLRKLTGGRS